MNRNAAYIFLKVEIIIKCRQINLKTSLKMIQFLEKELQTDSTRT